ncbi:TRAP transporter small permease subunit [Yunchengibacter salinarum]|uniref:TRAP transporter small permease subunit n=1 Tax=Yunchengibacter salinarum TaxID=3133399 RepID=UPI0035B65C16
MTPNPAQRLLFRLDRFLDRTGSILAVLPLLLMLVQFLVVVMVYVFRTGSIQLQESLTYINALMFLGGAGYTALRDGHVRVDLFYSRLGARGRAWVDLLGTLLLLMPFLGLFWATALPFVITSWAMNETSVESSGLPFVYVLKATLLAFPLTMSVAAVADLLRAALTLKGHNPAIGKDS